MAHANCAKIKIISRLSAKGRINAKKIIKLQLHLKFTETSENIIKESRKNSFSMSSCINRKREKIFDMILEMDGRVNSANL